MAATAELAPLSLLLFSVLIRKTDSYVDSELMQFIEEFFRHKCISILVIFACSDRDRKKLLKFLASTSKFWLYAPGDGQRDVTLETVVPQNQYKQGVFLDHTCPAGVDTLALNSERGLLNGSHHWLVHSDGPPLPREALGLALRLDSELAWATRRGGDGAASFATRELYRLDGARPPAEDVVGAWGPRRDARWKYHASRRGDLQGLNLLAALLVLKPHANPDNGPVASSKEEKYPKDIFAEQQNIELRRMFNFTVTAVPTSRSGYITEHDKYEGLVRLVGERHVNMSITPFLISNHKRLDLMQFVGLPSRMFRLVAVFRQPRVGVSYYALLKAFSPSLWGSVALVWVLAALLLRLLAWATAEERKDLQQERQTWSDVLLLVVGVLAEQGTSLDSRRAAWRLALLVMLVMTVLLNNYYGACVVSSLLTEPPSSIKTVRHLIDSPLDFGAEKMFYSSIMFELSSNPLVQELYKKKMLGRHGEKPVYYTREEGVTKMMREDFIFHTEAIPLYELINEKYHGEEKCRLTEIKVFPSLDMYIVVPHNSPLKEMLMCGLLRLSESGVLGHIKSKLIPKKPTCLPESELFSVELANVVPAFTILLSGVIVSIGVLMIELKIIKKHS